MAIVKTEFGEIALASGNRGSALTETILLCAVMVPLALMIPIIGKIIDLKQTTIQASRYSAWEQTVTTHGTAPGDIRARFYQDPEVRIRTGQVEQGADSAVNPLWGTPVTGNAASTSDPLNSDISISFAQGAGHTMERNISDSGVARSVGAGIAEMGKPLNFMSSVNWDVDGDGMINAGVQVNVRANALLNLEGTSCTGQKSNEMFACVSASNVIMVDGWDAGTNSQAENRSRAFVPAVVLESVGKGLSYLGAIPTFKELRGLEHAFGFVDSTQLPLDRYSEPYQRAQ